MKNNTYFQAMQQNGNEIPCTDGQVRAFLVWRTSIKNESGSLEVPDLPWDRDIHDFVETLRAAGISEFAVTDQSTTLMWNIHQLAGEGCTLQGLCKASRNDAFFGATEHDGILFRT